MIYFQCEQMRAAQWFGNAVNFRLAQSDCTEKGR
jgi:hypothetical protein